MLPRRSYNFSIDSMASMTWSFMERDLAWKRSRAILLI